ncbi:MAG: hypothetical protein PWR17_1326, partial [Candidatus Methanomethylophilaceae archaeon]|nr:hypothetical protein [Candidatus Methanomethylophilaceae archaeon]
REIFEAFGVEDPEHLELAPQNS